MAGNFFQKTLNGEPDTCWCVCVLGSCACTHPQLKTISDSLQHTHIWAPALSKPRVRIVASLAAPIACISATACVLVAVHETTNTRMD